MRRLQAHTWARLSSLVQTLRREREEARAASADDAPTPAERRRAASLVPYGVAAVVILLLLGTRDLLFGPLPAIGEFARAPAGVGGIWTAWFSGWNAMGLGSTSPVSTAFGSLALAGSVALGALDLVRRVAILGMIPIGAVGAWRLAKPLGSRRAQLTSLIVYVAIPVPYNAVSQGRWSGLILFAAAPWLLAALARAMHLEPFAPAPRAPDDAVGSPRREWLHRSLGLGLGLGVVATFVPAIVPVAILIAVGFALGSLVAGRVAGLGRLAGTVGVAALLTAVLQLPWTLGVVGPGGSWTALAGMRSGTDGWLSLGRILRFESGSYGAPPLGFAFLLAGALPLVIGRSWRFTWGARAWGSAVVCWAALWSGQQSWMPVPVPPAEVLLAPAAASLALAIACGTAAFDVDLPGYRFGWRQGASALAVLAVLVGSLPMIGGAADGRWRVPTADLGDVLDFIGTQRAAQPFRVVWAGDPDVVPAAGWRFSPTLDLAVSNDGMPTMTELWAPGGDTASKPLADALALARNGQTSRLGSILATMGVRYLVLPRQIVPAPFQATGHRIDPQLHRGLDAQLDLARMPVNSALVLYRNTAWRSGLTLLPSGTPSGHAVSDALDRPRGTPVLRGVDPVAGGSGTLPGAGVLATGQRADAGWQLTVDGHQAKRVTLDGWEQGFDVPSAGHAVLSHSRSTPRVLLVVLEAGLWLVVLLFWRRTRLRSLDDGPVTDVLPQPLEEGSLVQIGAAGEEDVQSVDVVDVGESEEREPDSGVPDDDEPDSGVPDDDEPDSGVPDDSEEQP